MSSNYRGIAANASISATKSISLTATSAGLIKVTTSTNHNLATGDRVRVIGHGAATSGDGKEANGAWTITVTSATEFTLNGSTFVANGGATGTVTPYNFANGTTLPDDGDDAVAASVDTPFEGTFDRHGYLVERVGSHRVGQQITATQGTIGTSWSGSIGLTNGAWSSYNTDVDTFFQVAAAYLDVIAGDVVEVEFATSIETGSGGIVGIGLFAELVDYGVSPSHTGLLAHAVEIQASTTRAPLNLRATYPVGALSQGQKLYLWVKGYGVTGSSSIAYTLWGRASYTARILRPQ